MRNIALAGAALAAVLLMLAHPGRSFAGQSVFDFESPQADQQGDYEPSVGVTVAGSTAQLAERSAPPWHWPDWQYRLQVTVTHDGAQTLQDIPLRIDLEGAPDLLFDAARLDGADLVFTADDGILQEPRWVERFDFIARRGTLWVRLQAVEPGAHAYYIYFGNPDAADPGSAEAVFTYSQPIDSMVVLSPLAAASQLTIQSFGDSNQIELQPAGLSYPLDARQSDTIAAADLEMKSVLAANGPFYGNFADDGTDALAPLCYASTLFVYPSPRDSNIFDLYAPFGTAVVDIYDDNSLVTSETVAAATPLSVPADITDGNAVRIEADVPVVVHHRAEDSGNYHDAMSYLPPDRELVGANTGGGRIVALQDNTQVDIYYSAPSATTVNLDGGQVYTLANAGSGGTGSGAAVHLIASAPIAGMAYGDGDGGEAITFFPRKEIGRRYLIPRGVEYVLISAVQPGVTCEILDSDGTVVDTRLSDTIAPPYPNRIRFGAVSAGSELRCDAPVFAVAEDATLSDERNLWPVKTHRPLFHPHPYGEVAMAVETKYAATEGTVETPVLNPAAGMSAVLSFYPTGNTLVPAETSIHYQVSNNGGASWQYHDGEEWKLAVQLDHANSAAQVHNHISTLPIESNRFSVKAVLRSETGVVTPVLDDLLVDYAGPGDPVSLVFDTIDSTQVAGVPFPITITAVDANGLPALNFNGTVELATYGGSVFPDVSPPFVQGQLNMDVAVAEVGENVVLRALAPPLLGDSNPFAVVAPDPSSLVMEVVKGDDQVGIVAQPLAVGPTVRIYSAQSGHPVPGVTVTFTVTEGGGTVSSALADPNMEIEVDTDAGGQAEVVWQLGSEPGRNVLQAAVAGAEGSPATFEARGDPEGTVAGNEEFWASGGGGCTCRTAASPAAVSASGSTSSASGTPRNDRTALFLLFFLAVLGFTFTRFRTSRTSHTSHRG
jgi:hypothetical protein